jgi:hypothetical protein
MEDLIAEEQCVFTCPTTGISSAPPPPSTRPGPGRARACAAWLPVRRTMWRTCSPPPPTIICCFSPIRAGSMSARAM